MCRFLIHKQYLDIVPLLEAGLKGVEKRKELLQTRLEHSRLTTSYMAVPASCVEMSLGFFP